MTTIALDMDTTSPTYGDILNVGGNMSVINGGETEVKQLIKTTLGVFFGEWFMNSTIGLDYFGTILVKNPDMGAINAMILGAILSVPGLLQVITYTFTPDFLSRTLTVNFTAQTTTGIITFPG